MVKTKDNIHELGQLIYDAREAKGWSSRALAERIGVHHSYMARLQLGEYGRPAPEILVSISRELGLKLADLYALAGYSSPDELPDLEGFLQVKYRGLPSKDVEALRGHLDYLANKAGIAGQGSFTSSTRTDENKNQ